MLLNIFYLGGKKDGIIRDVAIPDVWRYDGYKWSKQKDLYKHIYINRYINRYNHRTVRINNNYIVHVGGNDVFQSSNR